MDTIGHLRIEIKRYSDQDIIKIKEIIDKEYDRRYDREKNNKQLGG